MFVPRWRSTGWHASRVKEAGDGRTFVVWLQQWGRSTVVDGGCQVRWAALPPGVRRTGRRGAWKQLPLPSLQHGDEYR